jgi:hypothetical protein
VRALRASRNLRACILLAHVTLLMLVVGPICDVPTLKKDG